MTQLLRAAIERLNCPNNCASGCRSCLCDYSNQRIWDYFDRNIVLPWLKAVNKGNVDHPILKAGGLLWKKPSLKGLGEKLASLNHLILIGRNFYSSKSSFENQSVKWILEQMNGGKKISILFSNASNIVEKKAFRQREVMNYLRPYIENGQLSLFSIKPEVSTQLPCITTQPASGAPAWYSDFELSSILDEIIPHPAYELSMDNERSTKIKKVLDSATNYESGDLFPSEQVFERIEIAAGETRDLKRYFSHVQNGYVEKLEIKDPYCGADDRQISYLTDFLSFFKTHVNTIQTIFIKCKEQNFRAHNYKAPNLMRNALLSRISSAIEMNPTVQVIPFTQGRAFHDRSVIITMVDEQGVSAKHIFDLSGGIDWLMDEQKNTLLFYSKEE
jgi:hypothetical protein